MAEKNLPGLGAVGEFGNAVDSGYRAPMDLNADLETLKEAVDLLGRRTANIEQVMFDNDAAVVIEKVKQMEGQLRQLEAKQTQLEAACLEYRNAIIQMQQQIQTLARNQMQGGTRALAASLAVQGKGPGDPSDRLLGRAEEWYQFLNKDNPPPVAASTPTHAGNSVEDPSPTTH